MTARSAAVARQGAINFNPELAEIRHCRLDGAGVKSLLYPFCDTADLCIPGCGRRFPQALDHHFGLKQLHEQGAITA